MDNTFGDTSSDTGLVFMTFGVTYKMYSRQHLDILLTEVWMDFSPAS